MNASFDAFGSGGGWADQGENRISSAGSQRSNTFDKIPIPVNIIELQKLVEGEEKYRIGCYSFNTVRVIGVVTNIESDFDHSCITYSIIDTTLVEVKMAPTFTVIRYQGIDSEPKSVLLTNGAYVQAVGKLRFFNNRLSIISFHIREIKNKDEIKLFKIEAQLANLYYFKNIGDRSAIELEDFDVSFFSGQAPMRSGVGTSQAITTPGRAFPTQNHSQFQSVDKSVRKLYQETQSHTKSLSTQQVKVYDFIKGNDTSNNGVSIDSIRKAFGTDPKLFADLNFLLGEGVLYNTFDEDHFAII